jgi:hypothetical protein
MAQQNIDIRSAISEVAGWVQWALTTAGQLMMTAIFCASLARQFHWPTFGVPVLNWVDLMYVGLAWTCVSGAINRLFHR